MSEEEKGYGKPPKKHQFKKGVSGNPRGRPRDDKPKSLSILGSGNTTRSDLTMP